ncbi:hypothetical protein BDP27DRAFT_1445538 [Rhodocollybia butyracea]|uniref:Uncharacterized protein n=1 Tax=Rhodocollybia butyracea TaxID=206335 RepID=A0A9P5Q2C4_9AGAR|nr:hypothetical protein BDP27DRAFT_1445538 [Rhodocollybia butyracea]
MEDDWRKRTQNRTSTSNSNPTSTEKGELKKEGELDQDLELPSALPVGTPPAPPVGPPSPVPSVGPSSAPTAHGPSIVYTPPESEPNPNLEPELELENNGDKREKEEQEQGQEHEEAIPDNPDDDCRSLLSASWGIGHNGGTSIPRCIAKCCCFDFGIWFRSRFELPSHFEREPRIRTDDAATSTSTWPAFCSTSTKNYSRTHSAIVLEWDDKSDSHCGVLCMLRTETKPESKSKSVSAPVNPTSVAAAATTATETESNTCTTNEALPPETEQADQVMPIERATNHPYSCPYVLFITEPSRVEERLEYPGIIYAEYQTTRIGW